MPGSIRYSCLNSDCLAKELRLLVFLDDSGDPGFKVGKGSSKSFVIALVIFDDPLDAEETALKIKKLRRSLGKDDNFEFRFNKCRYDYRCRFLKAVAGGGFRIRAIVMPKERIYSIQLRSSKESFYNFSIKTVLQFHGGTIKDAKLRMDSHGEKKLRQELRAYLGREVGSGVIRDIKIRDSRRDVLIQLADMVAGSLRKAHDMKGSDAETYRAIIEDKVEDIWVFGFEENST